MTEDAAPSSARDGPRSGCAPLTSLPDWAGRAAGRGRRAVDRLLDPSVLVPAARVRKKVRIRLRGVRVSAAMKALGLTSRKGPRPRGRGKAKRAER